ncbi:MAG: hypothetical protein ACK4UU_02845 [Fimbriimonadales bacterium]
MRIFDTMLLLSRRGKSLVPLIVQSGATEAERYAAEELQAHLQAVTGAPFEIREADHLPLRAVVVGQGVLAERLRPDIDFRALGEEEVVCWLVATAICCCRAGDRAERSTPSIGSCRRSWACAGGRRGQLGSPANAP